MCLNLPYRRFASGFSLLELLVSISILVVVAVIGVSASSRLVETSRKATCAGNLRQIYAGAMAYAQDNNGYLPNGRGANPFDPGDEKNQGSDVTYIQWLWPYAYPTRSWASIQPVFGAGEAFNNLPIPLRKTIFECPGALDDSDSIKVKRSYAINTHMGDGDEYTHDRLIRIPFPTKVAFFADSQGSSKLSIGTINARHNGFANTLYLDGHIEAFVPPMKFTYSDPFWGKEQ